MNDLVDTKYRSDQEEIMDDFNYRGDILHDSLDKLAKINRWLGGNKVTIDGLKKLLENHPKSEPLKIIDLGCGSGDILRQISTYGKHQGYNFNLLGIDANPHTISYAQQLSLGFNNVNYRALDIFSEKFQSLDYDIVITTLFLHHFKEEELISFLKPVLKKAKTGIVVNDLHRHRMAYYLFKLLSTTIKNKTIVEDGLTSVLRGFKKEELIKISEDIDAHYKINWKWAFRYQWLLKKSGF